MADRNTAGEGETISSSTGTTDSLADTPEVPEPTTIDGNKSGFDELDPSRGTGTGIRGEEEFVGQLEELESELANVRDYAEYQDLQRHGLQQRIHQLEERQIELLEAIRQLTTGEARGASDESMGETGNDGFESSIPTPVYGVFAIGLVLIAVSVVSNVEIAYPLVGIGLLIVSATAVFESKVRGNRKR